MSYEYRKSSTGYRVGYYYEYVTLANRNIGNRIYVTTDELRKTVYQDSGADRTLYTADDILTTYLFDSNGQTVNVNTTDSTGNILGVTSTAYEGKSGTSGKNNKISKTVSGGQERANLLENGGYESYSGTSAASWTHAQTGGTIACVAGDSHSGYAHYELNGSDTSQTLIVCQNAILSAGKTYTASIYVNTKGASSFAADGGAYLQVMTSESSLIANGSLLQYRTDQNIDRGWQRLTLTFTVPTDGKYRMCLIWQNAKGTVCVDDAQLEEADAAGNFNHVSNGSFENGSTGWTLSTTGREKIGTDAAYQGKKALKADGDPGQVICAYQRIPLNKSSDTTFLLSGWSRVASIPNLKSTCDAQTDKFWGITIVLFYTDGTNEKHHLPFNEYVREWQHASMAVVPQSSGKTISYGDIRVCYYNDANTAFFDSISLTEEPAQTYKYDSDGNMISVKSTGNGNETYSYNSTTQNLMSVGTSGSGTYTYKYENSVNKHLPTSVINDTVTMNISYDNNGQTTTTTLKNSTDSWQMKSDAAYSNGLLTSQTDHAGGVTTYAYNSDRKLYTTRDASGRILTNIYEPSYGRLSDVYQSGKVSVAYDYEKGNLAQISRGGYIATDTGKQIQNYIFDYDVYGNITSIDIGNIELADYSYHNGNGTLKTMTYGASSSPLAKVNYTYDNLDRVKTAVYEDSVSGKKITYGYQYSTDGSLAGITENGSLKYSYQYDSLGRLIYSSQLKDRKACLYTEHRYDTSNRILSQSWQIGDSSFAETYSYNSKDGTLTSMTIGSDTLKFTYNGLKQLSGRTSPKLDMTYSYATRGSSGNLTTNRIAKISYLKSGTSTSLLPALSYTYDSLGNIKEIRENDKTSAQYTYDEQNQLTREILPARGADYTYDTYGNIRSKSVGSIIGTESYIYEYGSSSWLDLLTKVTYTNPNGTTVSRELTYDGIGNPLTYYNGRENWNFTWQYGRQLAKAVSQNRTITNTYGVDGVRETKTVGGITHTYTVLDGKIVREAYGTTVIDYLYDNDGNPYQMILDENGTKSIGYYVLNLQGDVIAILDKDGAVAVEYTYDAWGKEIAYNTDGGNGNRLYQQNALKYRGYYYDADLAMYYLNSRYYDPEIGRFINADEIEYLGADGSSLSNNLFVYCMNNPVNRFDVDGNWSLPNWAKIAIGTAAITVGVIATATIGGTVAPVLVASLKIAATSATIGAVSGVGISAVSHRVSTGSWEGAGKAAVTGAIDGACDGFMWGGIAAGATFATVAAKGIKIQEIGKLKPSNKLGDGYSGVKYQAPKANGKYTTKSIELHSPHKSGSHNVWHWQQNTWSEYNGISRITGSTKYWRIWGGERM